MQATLRHIYMFRTANMSLRTYVVVKQIQSNPTLLRTWCIRLKLGTGRLYPYPPGLLHWPLGHYKIARAENSVTAPVPVEFVWRACVDWLHGHDKTDTTTPKLFATNMYTHLIGYTAFLSMNVSTGLPSERDTEAMNMWLANDLQQRLHSS